MVQVLGESYFYQAVAAMNAMTGSLEKSYIFLSKLRLPLGTHFL
jgi:hypothetical protein